MKVTVQLCTIWLRLLGMFMVPRTCFAQIVKPSATRFIHVFDDGGNEVLSVDVYTYTDAVYSGDTLTITTSTSFFTNTMYYLLAVSGVCVCLYGVGMCVYMCICMYVCVHACVHVNRQMDRQTCVHTCVHAYQSVMPAFTTVYTCIVLAGVAVATARAFCPIESLAVTLPTEWPFGVTYHIDVQCAVIVVNRNRSKVLQTVEGMYYHALDLVHSQHSLSQKTNNHASLSSKM